MGDKEEAEEEYYLGSRLFKKMTDGRVIEILSDGSVENTFEVGDRTFDSYTTSLKALFKAATEAGIEAPPPEGQAPVGEGAPGEAGRELTLEEKVRKYMQEKHPSGVDDRLKALKKSSATGAYTGSVTDMFNDAPKATSLGGSHSMGGTHGLGSATELSSSRADPLKQMLSRVKPESFRDHSDSKATGYQAHLDRVYGGSKDSSMSASKKTSGLRRK